MRLKFLLDGFKWVAKSQIENEGVASYMYMYMYKTSLSKIAILQIWKICSTNDKLTYMYMYVL